MGTAIGNILAMAVGVAISPVPIIALILMLFTAKARSNSLSFVAGWLIGLAGAGLIVLAIGVDSSDGGESDGGGFIKIAIGVLFLLLGAKQWKGRPTDGQPASMPAWMESIDDFTAVKAFGLAFLLAGLNPKNLGLTIAAMASVSGAGLETSEEIIVLVVFVALASLTVIVPVAFYFALGDKADAKLTVMKDWLIENNNTVMAVLFVVLGAKVLGDGIAIVS